MSMLEVDAAVRDAIAARVAEVDGAIADACRAAGRARGEVTLLAVSKKQPPERIVAGWLAGLRAFGENYVQELEAHRALLPAEARWELIGHLQTNKAKKAAQLAARVHTVDSERLARALGQARPGLEVLVEVNVGDEASKDGVGPAGVPAVVDAARAAGLEVVGLMCIPPADRPPRPYFAALRALAEAERARTGLALPELSMGMSGDFADAILEGSTVVRVGSALFGARG